MEISTIIGIVVAIIICVVGLRMMLRSPNEAAPSLETELHINEDTNTPVIPRHVRNQLQTENAEAQTAERIEPRIHTTEKTESVDEKQAVESSSDQVTESIVKENLAQNNQEKIASSDLNAEVHVEDQSEDRIAVPKEVEQLKVDQELQVQSTTEDKATLVAETQDPSGKDESDVTKILKEPEFSLNPNVQTAEIKDYEEESSILDVHLHEQQRFDDESELARAEHIISLNVYPNPRKALSGDKTLKVLLKYGLRFGEMNCFHRYEDPEKVSPLMFSVLRITEEGPAGFDLEALSVEQVKGLAFFLALPHQNVQKGYDSMVSIAGLIARETDGTVYDENNLEFTPQLKEHWRHKAIDYRSGQEI